MDDETPRPTLELQPETTTDIHTYKYKTWVILLNLFSLIFLGIIVGIPLALIFTMLSYSFKSELNFGGLSFALLCVSIPIVALSGLLFIQLIISTISIFFSHIKITSEGIENRIWPNRHIRSLWSEVDRLGKFFLSDLIYLKSYKVIGLSLSYSRLLRFLNYNQTSIALSYYVGWPNGQLASDLKHYAPQLFENQPVAEEPQVLSYDSKATAISQENRLLAALSHASVLFTGAGMFVPLLIYVSQKKKSTFLAFHALQAFFFQLIGNVFGFVLPFCLFGVIFLPALGGSLSGKEFAMEPLLGMTVIITIVFSLLMMIGSILFICYGIIGAILTYQGKNFFYVIIGKRIEHRNHPG